MKKKTWIYLATGVLAAVALLAWAFAPRPVEVEVAQATRGRFEATIDEDAKTRLRDRYVVSAPLAGQLDRISLRDGDVVKAGDPLATLAPVLSPMLDERTRRELQARVEVAEAQVLRTDARIERAKVSLQQARNELSRSEQLAKQGFVSPTKVDNDRLAVLAAQKELEAASSERNVARHEVEQARTALIAVRSPDRSASRRMVLRAPIDGRVLRVVQPSEAAVALGTPLLELGDTRRLEIVAELLTTDALKTPPGSRVVIERWGGEGLLEGRVRLIEPAGFTKVSALGVEEQRVRVLIDITSPPGRWEALGDSFRVGVRIVTLSLDDAVKVPVSAVFPVPESEDGGMAVFKVVDGRARLVPVTVGARNGAEAWVRSGLQPGDVVVVYPPSEVKDGVRVAVRQV
jgi:HlyD family secretion protein